MVMMHLLPGQLWNIVYKCEKFGKQAQWKNLMTGQYNLTVVAKLIAINSRWQIVNFIIMFGHSGVGNDLKVIWIFIFLQ